MNYWLLKSEPESFSIAKLAKHSPEPWDGVRNYQARNFLRDGMRIGDQAFFYHSNCAEPGIAGIVEVVSDAYPDPTQFDPTDHHFDAGSDRGNPRWWLVDVGYVRTLKRVITLAELKPRPELDGFALVRRGNRLSVMPVDKKHWEFVLGLE